MEVTDEYIFSATSRVNMIIIFQQNWKLETLFLCIFVLIKLTFSFLFLQLWEKFRKETYNVMCISLSIALKHSYINYMSLNISFKGALMKFLHELNNFWHLINVSWNRPGNIYKLYIKLNILREIYTELKLVRDILRVGSSPNSWVGKTIYSTVECRVGKTIYSTVECRVSVNCYSRLCLRGVFTCECVDGRHENVLYRRTITRCGVWGWVGRVGYRQAVLL